MKQVKTLMVEKSPAQWDGMVIENGVVVTVGSMPTREALEVWLDDAVARQVWVDGSELPDMFDGDFALN